MLPLHVANSAIVRWAELPDTQKLNTKALSTAVANDGDSGRLQTLRSKLQQGRGINIGVVGGSISNGNRIDKSKSYGNKLLLWFQINFPNGVHRLYNLAVGAKDSSYFHYCLDANFKRKYQNSLSINKIDLWVIEHAANDVALLHTPAINGSVSFRWAHLEAEVRLLRNQPSSPAIIFIYFAHGMDGKFTNTQVTHELVAKHYGIPSISWIDYMRASNGYKPKTLGKYLADGRTHPTIVGHQIAAQLLVHIIQHSFTKSPVPEVEVVPNMPGGFEYDPHPVCLDFTVPESSWKLLEATGFARSSYNGKRKGVFRQISNGAHLMLRFNTTSSSTLLFLDVAHYWTCLPLRGIAKNDSLKNVKDFCPGKGRARIDRGMWVPFDSLHTKKYTLPRGIPIGIVSKGEHVLAVETPAHEKRESRIQFESLTGQQH